MSSHPNRGRITVYPLDTRSRQWHHKVLTDNLPRGWTAEGLVDDGLLARCGHTGSLAVWHGDRMVSVDANRAEAALRDRS